MSDTETAPEDSRMRFRGTVAVVTGGTSGIGRGIARHLHQEGAKVAIFGRDEDRLREIEEELGEGLLAVRGDVTRVEDLERLFAQTSQQLGGVDVLVASAGIGLGTSIAEFSEKDFDQLVSVNFKGVFFTVQKAIPHFNSGASVVLITSGAGRMALPGSSVYGATKAAVRTLARSISTELAPRGIRANALCCGATPTPGLERFAAAISETRRRLGVDGGESLRGRIPMKRLGTVEEMAEAALFLASSESRYICGVELAVDGGLTDV